MSAHSGNTDMSSVLATLLGKFATIESKLDAYNAQIANQESQIQGIVRSTRKRIFVRSVTNFVIGDKWFCSIFKLKMSDISKMVSTLHNSS